MALFGVLGAIGILIFVAGIVVPYLVTWLYRRGSGGQLSRAGWPSIIVVSLVGLLLGAFTGLVVSTFVLYQRVGGDGGILSQAFWTTVARQLSFASFDTGTPIFSAVVGVAVGLVGIFGALRTPRTPAPMPAPMPAPADAAPVTPTAPTPPPAPSAGVILNGQPLDPDKK